MLSPEGSTGERQKGDDVEPRLPALGMRGLANFETLSFISRFLMRTYNAKPLSSCFKSWSYWCAALGWSILPYASEWDEVTLSDG
jgi:hypothetical protein